MMLSLNVMVGRLILAVLAVGSLVLFALYLQEARVLGFISTVAAFAVSTYLNRAALGVRLDSTRQAQSRFEGLVAVLSEHPILRLVVGSRAWWLAVGVGLGVAVALTEGFLLRRWYGEGIEYSISQQAIVLALILVVVYGAWGFAEERNAYAGSEWRQALRRELYGLVGADPDRAQPITRIAVRAVGRSLLVTAGRTAALLILPTIVQSDLLLGALAAAVIAAIVGGEALWGLAQRLLASASWAAPEPTPTLVDDGPGVATPVQSERTPQTTPNPTIDDGW